MAGSAAQRELQMSMVPTPSETPVEPSTSFSVAHQGDTTLTSGWYSLLIDGARVPIFQPAVYITTVGPDWPTLVFNADSSELAAGFIISLRRGVARWSMELGTRGDAELGNNTGSDFLMRGFSDTGVPISIPIAANRATGQVTFQVAPAVATLPINAADDAAAAAAGVQIGGTYRNGSVQMVRAT